MKTKVHLLRGINVGGHKKIPMAQLRICYERLGLTHVQTYIQSGNVVFEGKITKEELEKSILEVTGFEVPSMLFEANEWLELVAKAPNLYEETGKEFKKYITLTQQAPTAEQMDNLRAKLSPEESLTHWGRALYLHYPSEHKKPFFTNVAVEKVLNQRCTARNWNTLKALANRI